MKTILVIGAGEFGSHLAKHLSELKCEVMVVDNDEARINDILPYVTNALIGDATSEEFVKTLGVGNYDICFVTLGNLFQQSLEATSLLKELGAKKVISRATNDTQMKFLLRNGADEAIYPEKQMAFRVATRFASDNILDFVQLDSDHLIYELKVPAEWYGKTIQQIDVRRKYSINILTVKRNERVIMPSADTEFKEDDVVLAIGDMKDLKKCFKL
ncbi:MAG: TrkA family potassium uptake protein [Lachnospiraceae bacterium]|nr:TrkA family potassium uptake protein [Lachnospiraceae bacterium]